MKFPLNLAFGGRLKIKFEVLQELKYHIILFPTVVKGQD